MTRIGEERKAELMRQVEALIDEFVDWTDGTAEPNLTQIEEMVLELRERFGKELAREAIEAQEAKQPVPGPRCPQCGPRDSSANFPARGASRARPRRSRTASQSRWAWW